MHFYSFLGYKTHADYILELRMAKNQEKVKQFLSELAVKLQPLWAEEKKELLELKKAECKIISNFVRLMFRFIFSEIANKLKNIIFFTV